MILKTYQVAYSRGTEVIEKTIEATSLAPTGEFVGFVKGDDVVFVVGRSLISAEVVAVVDIPDPQEG